VIRVPCEIRVIRVPCEIREIRVPCEIREIRVPCEIREIRVADRIGWRAVKVRARGARARGRFPYGRTALRAGASTRIPASPYQADTPKSIGVKSTIVPTSEGTTSVMRNHG
jgi:hypothetical protein